MNAKVRGIYATAITRRLLDAGHTIVQASGPIDRRFDARFPDRIADVRIETTGDRQGVGIVGSAADVATAVDALSDIGIDTFVWSDPLAPGTIADGQVTETTGGGAIVDLGVESSSDTGLEAPLPGDRNGTGYLPFDRIDDRIYAGDAVRVRIADGTPPWSDRRPLLDGTIEVGNGLLALVSGNDGVTVEADDEGAARELAGMTELLGTTPPEGWGIRWSQQALEADVDALDVALASAIERVERVEDAIGEAADGPIDAGVDVPEDGPGVIVSDRDAAWLWFGRDSRFELDRIRRSVETTMVGHHRIKAGSTEASTGVDFVEALVDVSLEASPLVADDAEFPFSVVADQFGPSVGDRLRIDHGKPDGRLFVLGRGTVVDRDGETVAVERTMSGHGTYDALGTEREAGDTALTKFREGRWWYPTVYRGETGELKGTYVNICTPLECFPESVRYVDLHVDVIKHPDGTVERVDDDELDSAVEAGHLLEPLAEKARSVATALVDAL